MADCEKCGQPHDPKRCAGHKNLREDPDDRESRIIGKRPCLLYPVKGLKVCIAHGGAQKTTRAKGAKVVAEQKAEKLMAKAVATYGLSLDVSPTEALLEEVRWTAGHVAWLRERVQEIEQDRLVWGKTKVEDRGGENPALNTTEAAAVNVWVDLYTRERKHLVDVCKSALQAGVEERRIKLAESQGALLAGVIQAILGDLDLSPEQQAKVATVVPRHLRAVS